MGWKRRALSGYISDSIGTLTLTILGFVLVPIILGKVDQEVYGYWLMFSSVIAYFGLVDMGLSVPLIKALKKENNNFHRTQELIVTGLLLITTASFFILFIGVVVSIFIEDLFGVNQEYKNDLGAVFVILIISLSLKLVSGVFGAAVYSKERIAHANILRDVSLVIGVIATFIMIHFDAEVYALAIGEIIGSILILISTFALYKGCYSNAYLKFKLFNKNDAKYLLIDGGMMQMGRIGNIVASTVDTIIVTAVIGPSQVVTYVLVSKLSVLFSNTFASKITSAIIPGFAALFSKNNNDELKNSILKLNYISVRLAIIGACGFATINELFLEFWVGKEYFDSTLNVIFLIWILHETTYRVSSGMFFSFCKLNKWALFSGADAFINIALSIILGSFYGLPGIAIATTISRMLTVYWVIHYEMIKELNFSVNSYLYYSFIKPLGASLMTIFSCFWFINSHGINDLYDAALGVLIFMSINLASFFYFQNRSFLDPCKKLLINKSEAT